MLLLLRHSISFEESVKIVTGLPRADLPLGGRMQVSAEGEALRYRQAANIWGRYFQAHAAPS